jgi:drug/metabolite transporter (DMT)-like permease
MTAATYALVLLSAAAHAYWNFLLKRTGGTPSVVGLSKIAEAVLLAPLLASGALFPLGAILDQWILPVGGAVLVLANYVLLTAAYRHGDLSLVYPLSRGAILLFLPPLAYLLTGEQLGSRAALAIALIVIGIAGLQLPGLAAADVRTFGRSFRTPATMLAVLAAFVAACYTLWDKTAIRVIPPLAYFAAYTILVGIAYAVLLSRSAGPEQLRAAWRVHRGAVLQVAVLNSVSYLLALIALQTGKASYVIALRQSSIAAGALLGWALLGESIPAPRAAGIGLVVAGCILLAGAR